MGKNGGGEPAPRGYLRRSMEPLHCLTFLLPFLAFYEIGLHFIARPEINAAHALMHTALRWVGISAYYAPAIGVVVIFLIWQIAGKYSWKVRGTTLLGMLAESIAFTVPLIVLHSLFVGMQVGGLGSAGLVGRLAAGVQATPGGWFSELVLSIGAGIYEELVFRLALVAGLAYVLERLAGLGRQGAIVAAVLVSAALFSAFHYLGASGEVFQWHSFLFRVSAAIYLSVLFASRGFGVTAGAHMIFDCVVLLPIWLT